jgi:hypothetical protein
MNKGKVKKKSSFTRRDFLKGFGSGTLGAAIAPKLLAQKADSIQTKEGKVPVYSKKQIKLTVMHGSVGWESRILLHVPCFQGRWSQDHHHRGDGPRG